MVTGTFIVECVNPNVPIVYINFQNVETPLKVMVIRVTWQSRGQEGHARHGFPNLHTDTRRTTPASSQKMTSQMPETIAGTQMLPPEVLGATLQTAIPDGNIVIFPCVHTRVRQFLFITFILYDGTGVNGRKRSQKYKIFFTVYSTTAEFKKNMSFSRKTAVYTCTIIILQATNVSTSVACSITILSLGLLNCCTGSVMIDRRDYFCWG